MTDLLRVTTRTAKQRVLRKTGDRLVVALHHKDWYAYASTLLVPRERIDDVLEWWNIPGDKEMTYEIEGQRIVGPGTPFTDNFDRIFEERREHEVQFETNGGVPVYRFSEYWRDTEVRIGEDEYAYYTISLDYLLLVLGDVAPLNPGVRFLSGGTLQGAVEVRAMRSPGRGLPQVDTLMGFVMPRRTAKDKRQR